MINSYFSSVGLTICSVLFMSLIVYLFVTKQKNKNWETKIFIVLMVITILIALLEFIVSYTIPIGNKIDTLNKILCYFYVYLLILWDLVCTSYFIIVLFNNENKLINDKNKKMLIIISGALILLLPLLIVLIFKVDYSIGLNNMPNVVSGKGTLVTHFISYTGLLILCTLMSIYREKIKNIYVLPFITIFISYTIVLGLQLFYNYEINESAFFYTILFATIFFTIESQDNKLLNEYKKSKVDAEIANRAKTEFLINMSHEVRTPMNTILGFGESLLKEEVITEDIMRSDMQNIYSAAETLNDLINNILDISKIESGKEILSESNYDLENLIFEINSYIPSKIKKEELKFTININENIPKSYYGDTYKIYKILTYILLNAIEYTDYGEVKLDIDGKTLENNEFEFSFIVSNTGHAMTEELFDSKFEDYVKIENASQNNVDSIKLGIIIAKSLTKIVGGEIKFVNEKGQGTKYFINIKQKVVNPEKIGNIFTNEIDSKITSNEILNCSGLKVLLVDDSDINLKLAIRYLQQFNFTIFTARSGKDCIETVKNNDYNIIFLDHMMPDMDGVATLAALKALGKPLPPVIALTANSYDGLKDEYVNRGFNDYLQKPINFKELNKIVNKFFKKDE